MLIVSPLFIHSVVLYGAQFNTGLWRGGATDSTPQQAVTLNESNSMVGKLSLYDNRSN